MKKDEVASKLGQLAELAEELNAELYTEAPEAAGKMAKIAAYSRKIATCVRLHGQVPVEGQGSPLVQAARSADQIMRAFQKAASLIPDAPTETRRGRS